MRIHRLHQPQSLEEAQNLLNEPGAKIIGGGMWLKVTGTKIEEAISLQHLKLKEIREEEQYIKIGAMTSLRQIETSQCLADYAGGALVATVRLIRSIQFRNLATLGGSVAGRYGFSDITTTLLALNARLVWQHSGEESLEDFLESAHAKQDILLYILLPKVILQSVFYCRKPTALSFSIVNVAMARTQGNLYIAIGARPKRSILFSFELEAINTWQNDELQRAAFLEIISLGLFGTNNGGSQAYRQTLARVYALRGLEVLLP